MAADLYRGIDEPIALVRLDTAMPVMDGGAALREMKAIRPEAKVILSRGCNEAKAVRRFAGTGLSGFIPKPYSSSRLIDQIQRTLEERADGAPEERAEASRGSQEQQEQQEQRSCGSECRV